MLKRSYLGEFEEIVLLTVAALNENAYGLAIKREILEQTGRNVRLNQVHASLHRLEGKAMVKSKMGHRRLKGAASPLTWLVMHNWLHTFAFLIDLTPLPFIAAGIGALVIAVFAVVGKP